MQRFCPRRASFGGRMDLVRTPREVAPDDDVGLEESAWGDVRLHRVEEAILLAPERGGRPDARPPSDRLHDALDRARLDVEVLRSDLVSAERDDHEIGTCR